MGLIQDVKNNEIDKVKRLVNHRNVDTCQDGRTLLCWTACLGHTGMCRLLLENGASIDIPNNDGYTPLMSAASRGDQQICKLLLEKGAAVNVQAYYDGWSALMFAVSRNHIAVSKCLLEYGADINVKNKQGKTAFDIANNKYERENIIKMLKDYLNKNNNQKYTQRKNLCGNDTDKKIKEAQKQLNMLKAERIIEKKTEKLKEIEEFKILEQQCYEKEEENKEIQSNLNLLSNLIGETKNFLKKNQPQKKFSIFLSEHNRQYQEKVKSFGDELDINNQIIETNRAKLKLINYTVDNYEALKQELNYLENCFQDNKFDEIIDKSKRECPICFEDMKPPILQCTDGHVLCKQCFHKICAKTKQCPFCKRILDEKNPVRNRGLEELLFDDTKNGN